MSASVWAATTKISGNTLSASQAFTAIENQETFNVTGYIYVPYSGALQVYKNGSRLILNTDWVEVSTGDSFNIIVAATAGDVYTAVASVGISAVIPEDISFQAQLDAEQAARILKDDVLEAATSAEAAARASEDTSIINAFIAADSVVVDAYAAGSGAALVGTTAGTTVQGELDGLTAGQTGGVIVFATYALLDAYTPTTTAQELSSFKVTNDSTSSLNGYYSWVSGTTYTKDANLVVNVIDSNNTSDGVSGSAVAKYNTKKNPYFIRAEDFTWALGDIDSSGNFVASGTTKIVADRYVLLVAGTKITINSGYEFNLAVYNSVGTFIRFEGAAFIQGTYTIVDEYNYRLIIKRTANTTIDPADIISVSEQFQINYTARLGEVGLAVNAIDDANTTFGVSGQAVSRYVNRKTPYFIRAEDFTWALGDIDSSGAPINANTRILPNRTVYLLAETELTVASGYEFNLAVYESDGTFIRFEGATGFFAETYTLPSDGYYLLLIQRADSSIIDPSDITLVSEQVQINYLARLREVGISVNIVDEDDAAFAVSGQAVSNYVNKNSSYFVEPSDLGWVSGNIDSSGNFTNTNSRVRANKSVYLVKGTVVSMTNGHDFNIAAYDNDGVFLGFENPTGFIRTPYTIPSNGNYWMLLKRLDSSIIDNADVDFIGEQIKISYTARMRDITTTTSDAILRNGTQINDVLNYVSSSDNNMVFDPLTGFVYVVYLASETEYGESDDANVLTVFPIKQPWLATHHVVAAKGEVIDGITIGSTFGCNLLHLDTVVRVFLRLSGIYYYRDYDKATKAFLPDLTKVQLDVGSLVDFKATSINDYLVAGGYSATSDVFMIAGFQLYSGFYYTMASSFNGNPIVMKSNDDGATWELLGIIPETAEYESCLAINETTELLCVLNRNIYDDNYFTSDDLGITFNAGQEVYLSNVRPRLLNYKGEILILHSEFADVPNMYCTSGRNNFMIKSGNGANVKDFQQKVYITSRFGLVYPSIINYKNDIYSCFSSGELYHEITNQCKDALNFVRIGEFFDGEDFIINQ